MKENFIKIKGLIFKNKIKSILILLLVIFLTTGTSLAYYISSKTKDLGQANTGNLKIEYIDGETIKYGNSLPLTEEEVDEYATKTTFKVKNTGNLIAYADIVLLINNLPPELDNEDFRWTLYKENIEISTGSFADAGNKLTLKKGDRIDTTTEGVNYSLAIWIRDNGGNQNAMAGKKLNAKISIEASDKKGEYAENGVNAPELAKGLIPVTYDDEKDVWVKANVRKKWYSYSEQMWANAVTVTSATRSIYESARAGTEIKMDDINSMWVWIPRFKYKIASNLGIATSTPPQIDVVFESDLSSTGVSESTYRNGITSDGTNTNYYTHPAFRNGNKVYKNEPYDIGGWDEELTGFWVAKFETGTSNEECNTTPTQANCNDVDPIIKPDVISLRNQNISTQFLTSLKFAGGTMDGTTGEVIYAGNNIYGLTNGTDTHMIKNTEWGAVAILSQSQYGKRGNNNYIDRKKEIYKNNSSGYYTGRSEGTYANNNTVPTTYGNYSYNDKTCSTDSSLCNGEKVQNSGTGASTTGTIYGIYDMSGGTNDRVMSNYEMFITVSDAGFNGTNREGTEITNKLSFPERKYYDLYSGTNSTYYNDITKTILGDAEWETKDWYSDTTFLSYDDYSWLIRGDISTTTGTSGGRAGIFYSLYNAGTSGIGTTFRTVLIP